MINGTTARFDRTNFEASVEELQEFQIYIDAQLDLTMSVETPSNSASGLQAPMNRIQECPVLDSRFPEYSANENTVLECAAPENAIPNSPVPENTILVTSTVSVDALDKSTQTSDQSLSACCTQVSASFQGSNGSNDHEVTKVKASLLSPVNPHGSAIKCPNCGSFLHIVKLDMFVMRRNSTSLSNVIVIDKTIVIFKL